MRTLDPEKGIVAVLDALGAASYSDNEIRQFLKSRELVLRLLGEKLEDIGTINAKILTFTFNDTIVVAQKNDPGEARPEQIVTFFGLMRNFIKDSLANNILFRGSSSIGTFRADENTNTVMGQAITDAAAWYNKAKWIGVHATPHAS